MGVRVYNKKTGVSVTCDAKYWADCKDHNVKAGFQLWTPAMTANVNHIPVNDGNDTPIVTAASYANSYVTEAEKEFESGNTFGGVLKRVPVTVSETGETSDMVVVNMQLGGGAIGLDEGEHTFVAVDKHEARFMDMDKMTAAMGYALFKDAFTANSPIYLYFKMYGHSGDDNIYRVERLVP